MVAGVIGCATALTGWTALWKTGRAAVTVALSGMTCGEVGVEAAVRVKAVNAGGAADGAVVGLKTAGVAAIGMPVTGARAAGRTEAGALNEALANCGRACTIEPAGGNCAGAGQASGKPPARAEVSASAC